MDTDREDPKPGEGTRVDLGEDLLKTSESGSGPGPGEEPPPTPDEDAERGRILLGEGLLDDAKKVFRKVLIRDSGNDEARQGLDEIQKREIQELLTVEPPRKRLGAPVAPVEDDSPSAVLSRLERDLRLGVERTEAKIVPDLFADAGELAKYKQSVLDTVLPLPPRERIDVGVGFLEMGLFEIAHAIFETVVRYEEYRVEGMYLLGLALICGGKAIEATIRLEPYARDLTLTESQKTDFLYLMGMAFERLGEKQKAREFFRRVFLLSPKYRDVAGKLG